jgi:hypothetical protein
MSVGQFHGLRFKWKTAVQHVASGLEGTGSGKGEQGSYEHAYADLQPRLDEWRRAQKDKAAPQAADENKHEHDNEDNEMIDMIEACQASGDLSDEENEQLQALVLSQARRKPLRTALARYVASNSNMKATATTLRAVLSLA